MKSKTDYIPISCNFVDVIEHFATLQKTVAINFLSGTDNPVSVKTKIKNWANRGGAEYMVLADGTEVRFDHIISIDEQQRPATDSCLL